MNIQEAKLDLTNTVLAYTRRNADGSLMIPQNKQRPVVLIGPPGIGKTAIMEQVAEECNVGLVAYTITHHTRQSAIGLPVIREMQYDGRSISVTEYTMSEIIASVYKCMEETGKREGILFIDEINCVSETLAPAMLQFLQCKQFGSHQVPEGWVIAAAGNPAGFNKSVRDFDLVTLDRVRMLYVEEDLPVFFRYAHAIGIHEAILSFLAVKPQDFYRVEPWEHGTWFVTARGWEDLSRMLSAYETLQLEVTENFIGEFLQFPMVAGEFFAYYNFYRKFSRTVPLQEILDGRCPEDFKEQLAKATHEERITLVYLMSGMLREATEHADATDGSVSDKSFSAASNPTRADSPAAGTNICPADSPVAGTNICPADTPAAGTNICPADTPAAGTNICPADTPASGTKASLADLWNHAVCFLKDTFGYGMELSILLKEAENQPPCAEYLRKTELPAVKEAINSLRQIACKDAREKKIRELYDQIRV